MDCYFHAVLMVKNYNKLKNVGISSIFESKGVVYLEVLLKKTVVTGPVYTVAFSEKTIT